MSNEQFDASDVMPWKHLDPPVWWPAAKMFVIADRHLPNGVRQHRVRGQVSQGLVIDNAQVVGDNTTFSESETK